MARPLAASSRTNLRNSGSFFNMQSSSVSRISSTSADKERRCFTARALSSRIVVSSRLRTLNVAIEPSMARPGPGYKLQNGGTIIPSPFAAAVVASCRHRWRFGEIASTTQLGQDTLRQPAGCRRYYEMPMKALLSYRRILRISIIPLYLHSP